ncbi:LYR motif-containing protein 4 isoform 1-T1 [Pangshura tecta]
MAASSRAQVLRLYRALLRESQRFTAYGYRTYAIRRIRDAFRENKHLKDSEEIQTLVNKARTNLEIIHRQAQFEKECSYWRKVLRHVVATVKLLSSLGLPVRRHKSLSNQKGYHWSTLFNPETCY